MEVVFLGTGHAHALKCFNTCFIIKNNDELFLVDTGGGNDIIKQLDKANINYLDIHNVFISHTHADHLFGLFWLIRFIGAAMDSNKYQGNLNIYCSQDVADAIKDISKHILQNRFIAKFNKSIFINIINHEDKKNICGMDFEFINLFPKRYYQHGFILTNNATKLAFLSDIPLNSCLNSKLNNIDFMLHEHFVLIVKQIYSSHMKKIIHL